MRITKIEIKNFRAFYGAYQIDLHKAGKNLLVYGENGSGKTSLEYEIPVYAEDKAYLDKAREYLDANDYKACAIYLRTAFEIMIEDFCDAKRLPVRYRRSRDKLDSQDFWDPIKVENQKAGFLDPPLIRDIELYRSRILNPLSHTTITNIPKKEIEDAIEAVERLKAALQ